MRDSKGSRRGAETRGPDFEYEYGLRRAADYL
jgi:hypothetical protein